MIGVGAMPLFPALLGWSIVTATMHALYFGPWEMKLGVAETSGRLGN
jgi:hypothetical protein